MEKQISELLTIKKTLQKEQRDLLINKFLRNRLAVIGSIIVFFMIFLAVFADVISPQGPLDMIVKDRLSPPSAKYLFGTDTFGRDVLSRTIYGARVSMLIGASVGLSSMVIGMILGMYAAYYKSFDGILMRICDGLSAMPSTLLAIALMAMLGPTIVNVIIAMSIVNIPRLARITRGAAVVVKEQTYIEAMHATSASSFRIIWGHIAPNVLSPVVVQTTYTFANAIITEAALSFLGVGVPLPDPSWGNILYEGKTVIYKAWWMIVYPGMFTALAVLGMNIFGDGLRDILDPYTK